ncbi:MAG TPA: hypothetical protein VF884_06560 [Nitrososphaeraceae archaeon]
MKTEKRLVRCDERWVRNFVMHFDVTHLSKHLKKLNIYDASKGRLSIRLSLISSIIMLQKSQYVVGRRIMNLK